MTTPFFVGWTPPESFGGEPLKLWPKGVFPNPFESFAHELARSTETPVEMAALTVLAVVAIAGQKRYTVQVKPDYEEMLCLWTCVAMSPGSRKSAVLNECLIPVKKFEKLLIKNTEPLRKGIESENKLFKSQLLDISSRAKTAKGQEFETLKSEALEIEGAIRSIPPPPQLWTSDVTPENLATIMKENDESMSILSDEGGIFDIFAGRYSKGVPNLDLILQAHSGGSCRVNRLSRPPIVLDKARLTMGLTPQPCVIEGLGNNKSFRGRGLLGRFLYALPTSNLGTRSLNQPPIDDTIVINYQEAVENLLETCSEGSFLSLKFLCN